MTSKDEISRLREVSLLTGAEAREAAATAATHLKTLEAAACRRAGVTTKYLELLHAVLDNPLFGAFAGAFDRIIDTAQKKEIVVRVHGGVQSLRSGTCSGNAWHELGPLGVQIMTDINGADWQYSRPSEQADKKPSRKVAASSLGM